MKPQETISKMLEFYPSLNINSGLIQDQSDNVLNTSLECGQAGKKENLKFVMKKKPEKRFSLGNCFPL